MAFATSETLEETHETTARLIQEKSPQHNANALLGWYLEAVRRVEPLPLGKQRSRDKTDDAYLACALAAGASFVVTYDRDLLTLGKPFGIEVLRPAGFLRRLVG
jgi:predicted nucleic acid-binding protein